MIESILRASNADTQLAEILGDARECAYIYSLARERQKGCDGMGELATLRDEFRYIVDKMIDYCQGKNYIPAVVSYDINRIADEMNRVGRG